MKYLRIKSEIISSGIPQLENNARIMFHFVCSHKESKTVQEMQYTVTTIFTIITQITIILRYSGQIAKYIRNLTFFMAHRIHFELHHVFCTVRSLRIFQINRLKF